MAVLLVVMLVVVVVQMEVDSLQVRQLAAQLAPVHHDRRGGTASAVRQRGVRVARVQHALRYARLVQLVVGVRVRLYEQISNNLRTISPFYANT